MTSRPITRLQMNRLEQASLSPTPSSRSTGVVTNRRKVDVLAREGRRCSYCGDTDGPFEFDHILPRARGGTSEASNLTLACRPCNAAKGSRTLAEWIASK